MRAVFGLVALSLSLSSPSEDTLRFGACFDLGLWDDDSESVPEPDPSDSLEGLAMTEG